MLELISREPDGWRTSSPRTCSPGNGRHLLFIHGAWHAAWCWSEYFMPYFAGQGYTVHALSLRGHGNSHGREKLRWTKGMDYVADVAEVVRQLPQPPVVVGHSMGGYVVQKYLESASLPGAVLLASVPPSGVLRTTLSYAGRHPLTFLKANATLSLYPLVGTPELAQEHLFSADLPQEKVLMYFGRLQDESYRTFLDMMLFNLPRPQRVKTPMLVLGGADDKIFNTAEVEATAHTYHAELEIFPHMAHDMMLEQGWQAVADRIGRWLETIIQ